MGEFASLLQLGFGVGVGLSVFRAPLELRSTYISKAIDDEAAALRGVKTAKAKARLNANSSLKLKFVEAREKLNRVQTPFMIATLLGALGNLVVLILASVQAARPVTPSEQLGMIFLSTIYFALIAIVLELIARYQFKAISADLKSHRKGK